MHTLRQPPIIGIKPQAPSPKILIAEDNLVNQKLMSLLFSKLNIQVDVVSNGQEAVDAAIANNYDMILMDIQMPIMDGVEASCKIKETLKDSSPVIVALTANVMNGDREKYLKCGMDQYLPKPVSFDDIRRVVSEYTTV